MQQFKAEYTNEAIEQLEKLDVISQEKILKAVDLFEYMGLHAKNSRDLGNNGLFEIKADKVRAYFKYSKNKIIIIGFIVLKKSQKAPRKYIEQAIRNIERYMFKNKEL